MKKILILSVTAGNGHNACAKGMKNKLEQIAGEDVEVKIVDLLKTFSTKTEVWFADSGYNLSVSKFLPIYHICYNHFKKVSPDKRWTGSTQKTSLSSTGGLLKEILNFKPDVVYCTHFYPAIAMTDLKLVYDLPCKVIVSNLDYVNSPFWESAIGVDYFIVPNEDFIEESMEEGFNRQQLIPYGIPCDGRTLEKWERASAREKLDLKQDVFTVMIMFGGGCWKGGRKIFNNIIKSLGNKEAQIIMINGRNEADYKRIEKMKFPNNIKVVNVGFTHEVPLYMAASDVIVNKFGGTSVTEMINIGRPMLITEKIPTQELYNLEYMKAKGVALSFKNKRELKENLELLYNNKELRQEMENKTLWLKKNSIVDLANFILSFDKASYLDICKNNIFTNLESVEHSDKECVCIRKKVKKAMKKAHKMSMKARRINKKEVVEQKIV